MIGYVIWFGIGIIIAYAVSQYVSLERQVNRTARLARANDKFTERWNRDYIFWAKLEVHSDNPVEAETARLMSEYLGELRRERATSSSS